MTGHGIASAIGFGGALPGGEMYAVVLFTTVPVSLTAASLFGTVALSTSLAALDMMDLSLLEDPTAEPGRRGWPSRCPGPGPGTAAPAWQGRNRHLQNPEGAGSPRADRAPQPAGPRS